MKKMPFGEKARRTLVGIPSRWLALWATLEIAGGMSTAGQLRPPVPPVTVNPLPEVRVTFGKSVQGRNLIAYVLGNGSNVTMVFGAFHGNEPATPGVVEKLRVYLTRHPEKWHECRVVLAPCVNPDGLRTGRRSNGHGVDINRNFPGTWRGQTVKARSNPGPYAASEPETKAVINLLRTYHPGKVISLHQALHTMIYTGESSRRLGLVMQKFNGYPMTADIGYPTPGSFGDYCGKRSSIAIITLELPAGSAATAWNQNRDALMAAVNR